MPSRDGPGLRGAGEALGEAPQAAGVGACQPIGGMLIDMPSQMSSGS